MTTNFVRSLGEESGVQLNPLVDGSEMPATGTADQAFCIAMRSTRGRIDKPFLVNSSNFNRRLGYGETIRSNELNEAWVQVFEAVNNGAYSAVVQRLVGNDASNNWMTATLAEPDGKVFDYAIVSKGLEPSTYDIAVKHHECFNDGIYLEIHADEKRISGAAGANDVITLVLRDSKAVKLYEFTGSLTEGSKDDYGNSNYLPDVIESLTDSVEVRIKDGLAIAATHKAYGFDENGDVKWDKSPLLIYFTEGEVGGYTTATYVAAREKLQKTQFEYRYIASGGTKAVGLLTQLAKLAHNTNRQFRFDVDGRLTPDQAIAFNESLNITGFQSAHLIHAFYTPLKTTDPSGVNGKSYIGTSALNIAYACARNAAKNYKGFAPKNYPIAGKLFPLNRTGIIQMYTPDSAELSKLVMAKINPVIYESYESGGLYVFRDSLTCAPVTNSLRKLISVVEMATTVDDAVTSAGKTFLQLPIAIAVKKMNDWLPVYFEGAEASDWLVPSDDPAMGGASFKFEARPNAARPYDQMDVGYWARYDGTARQMFITHTLTK